MQQPGHVVVVVPDAEAVGDEVTDHGPGPHTAGVPGDPRAILDQRRQLGALRLTELRRRSGGLARQQSLDPERLVPPEPAIDRPPRHAEFLRQHDDSSALDVSEDGACSAPDVEVVALVGSTSETTQLRPS